MKKFIKYAANTAFNGYSVAIYQSNPNLYTLQIEKDGTKVRNTKAVEMTPEEYEALPSDPANSLVRLNAAMLACDFHLLSNN
ncbi:hypothetical protein [Gallibacterium anatis]|uniref:Uncharacterized protein n=1 Tax=Gallibacterium anatis TaxID=750 RepID=A0A0A2XGX0_9PAST|nr:hypothetical protein [Gallibacterium anatis]KGQ30217.1 hypothetical protein JP32_09240 [Gallibacterium anatis]KGQ58438.1 hypothetical protein IE01_01820 [Gallibacterium anatis DSM 16844 = F 149]STO37551.1 Uncharacterised protein [Gallibacterium anatis]STO61180.1 Uncharacterised protein [Gallibacterium anatis]